jgi:hypothetical protein
VEAVWVPRRVADQLPLPRRVGAPFQNPGEACDVMTVDARDLMVWHGLNHDDDLQREGARGASAHG